MVKLARLGVHRKGHSQETASRIVWGSRFAISLWRNGELVPADQRRWATSRRRGGNAWKSR